PAFGQGEPHDLMLGATFCLGKLGQALVFLVGEPEGHRHMENATTLVAVLPANGNYVTKPVRCTLPRVPRPRTHDDALRVRLLDRAGVLLSKEGMSALSLRRLAA